MLWVWLGKHIVLSQYWLRMQGPSKSLNHNAFPGPNPRSFVIAVVKNAAFAGFTVQTPSVFFITVCCVSYCKFAEFSTLLNHSPWNTLRLSELSEFTKHSSAARKYIMMTVVTWLLWTWLTKDLFTVCIRFDTWRVTNYYWYMESPYCADSGAIDNQQL
jgi:hypothetical protein